MDDLRSSGKSRIAIYLAAFDEAAQLFGAATADPVLGSLPWYGSDGVALSPRLLEESVAARFAEQVGYPNPTLGLDAAATRRSRGLVAEVRAKLGSDPDAFALTAYDALRIATRAALRTVSPKSVRNLKRALVRAADGYVGVSGKIVLNPAGDRAFASYDFWSICTRAGSPAWTRTWSYLSSEAGKGRIVARDTC
jgi:branched-chain amino acid transport system substrate-binding protein